ncbi:hypothetical protein IE81DRAFT_294899 [Ceraceosorus guamensis]|uniref:STEEP1 domain-containing protein n=1 Tax=Ceraceosorus guamensis TaxID=1522189 RepID=A0A316VSM8_9BASI|nr:hypothetical protein IE81DRAFT_294899 [Ceraceosorus guamensis]PWN39413.1 hypothetical protein IE81DRAFT_294899 [Ceraceosorus guamensis]
MPKIISRSVISASAPDDTFLPSSLKSYYCLCGEFILVLDGDLRSCPTRPLDGSYCLNVNSTTDSNGRLRNGRTFKVNARQAGAVLLRRADPNAAGNSPVVERQYRFECPRCSLCVGYENTPPPLKSGRFTYILKGALSDVQGRPPKDALLDE